MMPPPPSSDKPLTPGERWGYGLFLAVLLGLFGGEILHDFHPAKLAALFVVLFWAPMLVVHEGGHAVVAALLGWRVRRVVLGFGRVVGSFRVGGVPVELRLFPIEGFVEPAPRDLRAPRLKNALIYAAGPGVEVLLVAIIAAVVGLDTLTTRTTNVGMLAVQSLCVTALIGAIVNLIPTSYWGAGGVEVANDGLGILRSFSLPDEYFVMCMDPEDRDRLSGWQAPVDGGGRGWE
jgi:hypothetical protein